MRDTIGPFMITTLTLLLGAVDSLGTATRPRVPARTGEFQQVDHRQSSLAAGEADIHYVAMTPGRDYRVSAHCGVGCNMDLQLSSPRGHALDRDLVRARSTGGAAAPMGRYRVDATMATCPSDVCDYALVVLMR